MEGESRYHAMVGDTVSAEISLEHSANLIFVSAFFDMGGDEEGPSQEPELMLRWSAEDAYDPLPSQGLYDAENVRRSVYVVSGTVPPEAPPGVYRMRGFAFQTAANRYVRFGRKDIDELLAAFEIEVVEERPERTRPVGFSFRSPDS